MMQKEEILKWCESQDRNAHYLTIPEEMFKLLNNELAVEIATFFNNNILIKLPQQEIEFFEWLKENDRVVWDDLWADTDEEPYLISISFLPMLIDKLTGFPICDLMSNDNYYFTHEHIIEKEAKLFLESVQKRFENKEELTLQQALILQISIQPIDIWHFAYHYNTNLEATKRAAEELAADKMLLHVKNAEHLTSFIRF